MPALNNIAVRVIVDDQLATEYPNFNFNLNTGRQPNQTSCFIRAEPAQSLVILVDLLEGYDLQYAPYILVKMRIDGFPKPSRRKCKTSRMSTDGQTLLNTGLIAAFASCNAKDDRTGQWFRYKYAFRPLESSTTDDVTAADLTEKEAADLGSIRISVCRAMRTGARSRAHTGRPFREVDRVAQADLGNKDLSSTVQRILDAPVPAPRHRHYKYIPLPGARGEKVRFTYYYRSKTELQGLGLIAPPPPPQLNPFDQGSSPDGIARTRRLIERKERELANLNAMLEAQNDEYDHDAEVRGRRAGGSGGRTRVREREVEVEREVVVISSDSESESGSESEGE